MGVVFACSVTWVRSVHFLLWAVVLVKAKSDSSLRSPPSHQHHSGGIQASLPATTVLTQLGDTAFTRPLISQTQSVVRESYLSLVSRKKFSCALRQTEKLTFDFNCGICIWRHVIGVDAHVLPRVIRPWFIDSTTKKERKRSRISSTFKYSSVDL